MTPFAQLLNSLHHIRGNVMMVANIEPTRCVAASTNFSAGGVTGRGAEEGSCPGRSGPAQQVKGANKSEFSKNAERANSSLGYRSRLLLLLVPTFSH